MRSPALLLAPLLFAAACSTKPSRLDALPSGEGSDPWSANGDSAGGGGGGALGGFDIKGTLEKIAETLKTPGPYEAPEHSAGFDAAKPHWGVLDLGGGIVERQAYSMVPWG